MIDYSEARRMMVNNQLRTTHITDKRVLSAMGRVPREIFVPESRRGLAYIDEAHPLGSGRYLAAPAPFGRLVQLADVAPSERVLDIGSGTGYPVAVLAELATEVVGVESDADLAAAARRNLTALGINNASIVEAPLETGPKRREQFDVVIVEGAVDKVPQSLFSQLKDGGRLVALVRNGPAASACVFVKAGKDVAARAEFNTSLPPLASVKAAEEFVF